MTVITVTSPSSRFDLSQRRELARTLTDAVLAPEVGQQADAARPGFQVHFVDIPADHFAIGGALVADTGLDTLVVDVAVMDSHWPSRSDRRSSPTSSPPWPLPPGWRRRPRDGGSTSG